MSLLPIRRRWFPLLSLAGLVCLLLTLWALLAAGWLSGAVTAAVRSLTGGEEVSVGVYGLRSDLLWSSSADSVVVRGERGLRVRLAPARIRGSVPAFLLGEGLDSIGVGRLEIALPGTDPDPEPDTLSCILESIRAGFVTSADVLTLGYGVITDSGRVVVDSMSIATSISLNGGLDLAVGSVTAGIPGLGTISGGGHLGMRDCVALTDGFRVEASPGSLLVSGCLDGTDGALDFRLWGGLGPDLPGVGLPLRLRLSGALSGTLRSPLATLRAYDARMRYSGESVDLAVDTLVVSPDSARLRGLSVSGFGIRLSADGAARLSDLSWRAEADASLASADLSRLLDEVPATSLSGSASLRASGTAGRPAEASLSAMLSAGSAGPVVINSATLAAELSRERAGLQAILHTPKGSVEVEGSAGLGAGMVPVSYSGTLSGRLSGSSILEDLAVDLPVPTVQGVTMDLEVRGTPSEMRARGSLSVQKAVMDSVSAGEVGFRGAAAIEFGGTASLAGSLGVASAGMPGLSLSGLSYRGELAMGDGPLPDVDGTLSVDSLRAGGISAALAGSFAMSRGALTVQDLSAATSAGYELSTDLTASMEGDTVRLAADSLSLVRRKMRLLSGGELSASWWDGGMAVEGLSLPTPHGPVSGSAYYSGTRDSLRARLRADHLDLASLSGLLIPGAGLSGVGSIDLMVVGTPDRPRGHLRGRVLSPALDPYRADSLTIDVSLKDSVLTFDGVYSWEDSIRSGFRAGVSRFWADSAASPRLSDVLWAEVELTDIGDWLFYALPIPLRTRGARISANAAYSRDAAGEPDFDMQLVATAEEMIITAINQHLPNVSLNVLYSYPTTQPYSARLSLTSGAEGMGKVTAQAMFKVIRHFPVPEIGSYYFRTYLDGYRIVLGSYASVSLNGELRSQGEGMEQRPLIEGDIQVAGGYLGMPPDGGASGSSGGEASTLPVDLRIEVNSRRGLWFRSSMADLELAADLVVVTSEGRPSVNGELSVSRGNVYVLQKDFRITEGRIGFEPGVPPSLALDITAETRLRGIMDQSLYSIVVRITGSPQSPDVVLSGSGPGGELSQEDILSLLATGLTYGQLQQVDTGALGTGLEDIAQGYIGKLLARSLRDDIGLDAFSMSPELLSDTTSFRFNVGKYILPELFVSYEGDVLSAEPGTVSAQYFISEDVYLQGSTKPTVHGDQEPSLELHYTFSY
jgi:hypothetical protein